MRAFFKYHSKLTHLIELITLKYLYIYSTNLVLSKIWYPGTGGYDIDFDINKELIGSVVFILVAIVYLSRKQEETIMSLFLHFLFVMYYIPLNSAFAINNMGVEFMLLTNTFFLLCVILLTKPRSYKLRCDVFGSKSIIDKETEYDLFNTGNIEIILAAVCVVFVAFKFFYNGFSFSFSFLTEEVYSRRENYAAFRSSIAGSLFSYFFATLSGLSGIAAPVYLYISLNKRKFFGIVLSLFCILCSFAVSSGKSSLVFILIVFAIFHLHKNKMDDYIIKVVNVGMIVVLLLCILLKIVFGSSFLYILIVRREMYVPSWLGTMYYDFFSQNPKVMFSDSAFLLQNIMPKVHSDSILNIINKEYFLGTMPSPNTGLFAEAYMHLGWLGVFLFPILLRVLMKFSSAAYQKYGGGLVIIMAARAAISSTNIPLLRTDFVLSYILITFLFMFMPKISIAQRRKSWR